MRFWVHFAKSCHLLMRFVIFPLAHCGRLLDVFDRHLLCLAKGNQGLLRQFVVGYSMLTALQSHLDHARLLVTCMSLSYLIVQYSLIFGHLVPVAPMQLCFLSIERRISTAVTLYHFCQGHLPLAAAGLVVTRSRSTIWRTPTVGSQPEDE